MQRLRQAVPEDRLLLVGNESIALEALALGADGMISGLSTAVPEPFVAMTRAFGEGNLVEAQRQQDLIAGLLPLLASGARIGAIKAVLAARGIPVRAARSAVTRSGSFFLAGNGSTAYRMKLLLFDIDGTLIRSNQAGRMALGAALEELFGTAGPLETYRMGGKTDSRIIKELMTAAGIGSARDRGQTAGGFYTDGCPCTAYLS